MDRRASGTWVTRALAGVLALLIAIGTGTVVASAFPTEDPPPAPPPASEVPNFQGVAAVSATIVDGLRAELPVPEPPPSSARAATPEVAHGLLEIPSIGLSQTLYEGVTLTAIDRGPSHWPGSAMPGELGNVVVAGHRTTKSRPFWDLDLVQPGDELIFSMANGDRFVYELDRTEIVPNTALSIVDQSYEHRATLFGCHPKGSARQRIVGHFTLTSAEYATAQPASAPPTTAPDPSAPA